MSVIINPGGGTGGGGMAIGGTVTSGTPGSVLWVDGSGNLAQNNANLFWDNSGNLLDVGGGSPGGLHVFNTVGSSMVAGTPIGLLMALTYTGGGVGQLGVFDWTTTPGVLTIGSEATGGGSVLPVQFVGTTFTFPAASLIETTSTVAALGSAGTAGTRAFVTDATATTFGTVVAGAGANKVPVYADGTNWRIG